MRFQSCSFELGNASSCWLLAFAWMKRNLTARRGLVPYFSQIIDQLLSWIRNYHTEKTHTWQLCLHWSIAAGLTHTKASSAKRTPRKANSCHCQRWIEEPTRSGSRRSQDPQSKLYHPPQQKKYVPPASNTFLLKYETRGYHVLKNK